jgi:hypothetical protein
MCDAVGPGARPRRTHNTATRNRVRDRSRARESAYQNTKIMTRSFKCVASALAMGDQLGITFEPQ